MLMIMIWPFELRIIGYRGKEESSNSIDCCSLVQCVEGFDAQGEIRVRHLLGNRVWPLGLTVSVD